MATVVAQASGNFSAGATWVGGVKPQPGDIAQTGNYTVTIDEDFTGMLNPTGSGRFDVATGGITITGDLVMASTYTGGGLRCAHVAGTVTLTGTATGGSSGAHGALNNGAGTLSVGTATGGSGSYAYGAANISTGTLSVGTATGGSGSNAYGAYNASTGTLSVGTATGSSGIYAYGALNNGAGTLSVGTATGGSGSYAYGAANISTGTLSVGTATGGSGSNAYGAYNASTGTLTVGTATGGSGSNAYGALNNGAGTLSVGTATGGSGSYAYGAYNASTGICNVTLAVGNLWGPGGSHSNNNPGVCGSNTVGSTTTVQQIQFGAYGAPPIGGAVLLVADASNSAQFRTAYGGATKTLTDSSAAADYPAISDVRSGTAYANGDSTGTCAVPSANDVAYGIPVDATTGTAVLTAAGVRAAVGLAAADLDTQLGDLADDITNITVDNAAIATAVRAELATELARVDVAISSRGTSTLDAAGTRAAVGLASANLDTQIAGLALEATLTAIKGAGWTTETLVALDVLLDAIKARTDLLSAGTATITSLVDGGDLTVIAGATFDPDALTGLTIPATWATAYWTVKRRLTDTDAAALVQVVASNPAAGGDGLLTLNGATAADASYGSLALDASAGTATLVLADEATAELAARAGLVWDIKVLLADGSSDVVCSGEAAVVLTPTLTH